MAEALLGGLLGKIYSQSDTAKRKLRDLLNNPVEGLQQMVGNANDRAGLLNQMTYAAANEGIGYGPETKKLASLLAESYNPVGMFIGAGSKAFDKSMAFKATKMEKKGATPQEIWKETGTVRGPDGLWRQEISDAEAKFVTAPEMLDKAALLKQNIAENKQKIKESKEYPDLFPKDLSAAQKLLRQENDANKELVNQYTTNQKYTGVPAELAINHPELFKAYPELSNVTVKQGMYEPRYLGSFEPKSNILSVSKEGLTRDPRSTALHEMQHAIQEQEGFAVGGNLSQMERLIADAKFRAYMLKESDEFKAADKAMQPIWDDYFAGKITKDDVTKLGEEVQRQYPIVKEWYSAQAAVDRIGNDPLEAYKRLIGEAEARLTQTRKDLSPEQRKQYFPFELQDQKLNPYGLDYPVDTLLHMDRNGGLVEKGLLGQ